MNQLEPIDTLKKTDYDKGFLQLLEKLTVVGADTITFEDFCKQYDRLKNEVYVIRNRSTNRIVATGSIFIEHKFIRNLSSVAHIEDVVVDPEYRGHNLGKSIVNHLIGIAIDKGCYKVILDCSDNNIVFYEKCGFARKGVEMSIYF
ncbi:MAG: acetyltransferase GNAT family protein [Homavirus sp.]|uniref:Acetyltransferase GNAT family protein n=1 Tax=Homavirus sp. TaxID=2487769 RepID=A0A3G5A573_9VIRU|nr:MAG: acetyltransferase GNAT family protein [Homavirus sp.]